MTPGSRCRPEDFAPGAGETERVSEGVAIPDHIRQLVEATSQRQNSTNDPMGFRFSVSVLPSWAQKKVRGGGRKEDEVAIRSCLP